MVQHWPAGLPLPTVRSAGPGVAAVRFRASVAYKGPVGAEVVVHLLGTGPRISKGQTWTVFANRDAELGLFTTECSGDQRGALADPAAAGLVAAPVATGDWRSALGAPALALLAIAAVAGGVALVARRLTEHRAVEHLPE